jgi:hypothetical protein
MTKFVNFCLLFADFKAAMEIFEVNCEWMVKRIDFVYLFYFCLCIALTVLIPLVDIFEGGDHLPKNVRLENICA